MPTNRPGYDREYRERQQSLHKLAQETLHGILLEIKEELASLRKLVQETLQILVQEKEKKGSSPSDKKESTKEKITSLSPQEENPSGESSKTPAGAFDRWWAEYPEKVGKGAARKAFTKALTLTSLDQLHSGLARYKANKPIDRAWCNPATWLGQERWNDAYANGHEIPRQDEEPWTEERKQRALANIRREMAERRASQSANGEADHS